MIGPTLGDLAYRFETRTRSTELKQTVSELTRELSTGRISDPTRRLGGDFGYLGDIEQTLVRLQGYGLAASEAAIAAEAGQLRLTQIHDVTGPLSATLLGASVSTLPVALSSAADQARAGLESVVASLNGSAGGRSLFAGTATGTAPLISAEDMLAELRLVIPPGATPADIDLAVGSWFADPAGFEALAYRGSTQDLAPSRIGPSEEVSLSLRADDPGFRDLMHRMATAALSADPGLALAADARADLLGRTGRGLLIAQDNLTGLRADLGFAQERIEESQSRAAAARTSLEGTRATLIAADPYETASRLEEARFQLESLYAVTARMSRLSLVNFLK